MKKKRFFAFILDFSLLSFLHTVLHFSFFSSIGDLIGNKIYHLDALSRSLEINLSVIVALTYFTLCYHFNHGRTFGQKVFGLITMKNSFKENYQNNDFVPELKSSLRRSMGHVLTIMSFGIPLFLSWKNPRGDGLADWYSQTSVVTETEWYELYLKHQEAQSPQLALENLESEKAAA